MIDILSTVDRWLALQERVGLATVISTWGSSPRRAGAKLAVTSTMAMIGSVSGGCVESAVVQEALESIQDGKLRQLHFGVSDDIAWDVGLACGGKIDILVERLDTTWWQYAAQLTQTHQGFTTITILDGPHQGAKLLLDQHSKVIYSSVPAPELAALQALARTTEKNGSYEIASNPVAGIASFKALVDIFIPQPKLFIVGGAHVALALATYAKTMGWYVALDDPRQIFASKERFPNVDILSHEYPHHVLPKWGIDFDCYIAILTHDPKIDDPALHIALNSDAPYIGILSSRHTHQTRIERLTRAGINPALFEGLHVPIGLNLGANTPEEIALCIMAEMLAVRNGVQSRRKVPVV